MVNVLYPGGLDTFSSLPGWKPWELAKSNFNIIKEDQSREVLRLPYGIIPKTLLPLSKFRAFSTAFNLQLQAPWTGGLSDPASLIGAGGFTLGGVSIALGVINAQSSQPGTAAFGLGASLGPRLGYCIADKFHERIYVYANATRGFAAGEDTIITSYGVDAKQRSILKRYFVFFGEIASVSSVGSGVDRVKITLDVNQKINSELLQNNLPNLKIIKKDGTTLPLDIQSINDDFEITINLSASEIIFPESGDMYVFDKPILIEDPHLMSGLMKGSEDTTFLDEEQQKYKSGFDLPMNASQKFFVSTNFTGAYVFFKNGKVSDYGTSNNFNAEGVDEWRWCSFADKNISSNYLYGSQTERYNIYKSEVDTERTQELVDGGLDGETALVYKAFPICGIEEAKEFANLNKVVRLEIADGGCTFFNNYHSPILTKCFIKQGNNYFKILNQIDSHTIDVEYIARDGFNVLDLDKEVSIFNHFAWKINEHHYSEGINLYGRQDETDSSTVASNKITTKIYPNKRMTKGTFLTNNSPSTLFGTVYSNSFHNRFMQDYTNSKIIKAYKKGIGWFANIFSDQEFKTIPIKKINISLGQNSSTTTEATYNVSMELESDVKDFRSFEGFHFDNIANYGNNIGGSLFDIDGGATGNIVVRGHLESPQVQQSISENSLVGICEDIYWSTNSLNSGGKGTRIFITAPQLYLGVGSCFSEISQRNLVLYNDKYTNKLSIRGGTFNFRENVFKNEIAFGPFSEKTIYEDMNKEEERLTGLLIKNIPSSTKYLMFKVGSEANFYGASIEGNGAIELYALKFSEQEKTAKAEDYQYDSNIVNPVYIYAGTRTATTGKYVYLGTSTSKNKIYVADQNNKTVNNSELTGFYVNENQTIEESGIADIFVMEDGEAICIYNKNIGYNYYANGEKVNWERLRKYSSNSVFMLGSNDHDRVWGTPYLKKQWSSTNHNKLPIMVANDCEYLCAFYDRTIGTFGIFTQNWHNSKPYVGFWSISRNNLSKNLIPCYHEDAPAWTFDPSKETQDEALKKEDYKETDMPFFYRVPQISAEQAKSEDKSPVNADNIISTLDNNASPNDSFVRVLGDASTSSAIDNAGNSGIVSCYVFKSGYTILFYDSNEGLRFIYSKDHGLTWRKSAIILSKTGSCGATMDGEWTYFVITGRGVFYKETAYYNYETIINLSEGGTAKEIEVFQKEIDNMEVKSIGTGVIEKQRLSGYVSNLGVRKIFYYDSSSRLSSMECVDGVKWIPSVNF